MSAPKDSNPNIQTDAGEWLPDISTEMTTDLTISADDSLSAEAESSGDPGVCLPVTFVKDPFSLRISEVADAQNQETLELDAELDEELNSEPLSEPQADAPEPANLEFTSVAETDAQLERLSKSIAQDEARKTIDQQEAEAEIAQEQAALLAAQIAEDEALAKALQEQTEVLDPELLAALPQRDENGSLDLIEMQSCIEALLFMLDKPVSAEKLQDLLTATPESEKPEFNLIQEALTALKTEYRRPTHGFELVEVAGGWQFRTKPGRAALAKKLAKIQNQRLSSGAMETLAIIAYKQPVLKEDVDKVRGVDSSHFIRGLMDKKLIAISGRSDLPGRPMQYSTTREFLELFGLRDLQSLPPLHELEQMVPSSQSDQKDEDPRVVKMRKLVSEMNSDQTRLEYNPREDEVILKEIKDRVSQISTSTPYLDEQKAIEKAVALAKAEGREIPEDLTLLLNKPEPPVVTPPEPGTSE
jgi:segregation and condensation protein B